MNDLPLAPTVREVGGLLLIEWPDPRPEWFAISSEAFENLVEQLNDALKSRGDP